MTEPKLYFDNEHELLDVVHEWQERLGLSDWYIAARICKREDMNLEDCAGESEVQFLHKCALVSILRKEDLPNDLLIKQPMEETVIHELLHCRFISFDEHSREDAVFEIMQHQLLNDMARALFITKYNLSPDWFIAEKHLESEKSE